MRTDLKVFAALAGAALLATPLFMSGGKALAVQQDPAVSLPAAVTPVEVSPVAAPAAKAQGCTRKVRVVYGGYGETDAGCAAR